MSTLPVPPTPPNPAPSTSKSTSSTSKPRLFILDYGAGNVRSLANSIRKLGFEFEWIEKEEDFGKADKLIFPGVGSFGHAMTSLRSKNLFHPLLQYIREGKPYFGICIGMQALFLSSLESPGTDGQGLGVIPGKVGRFEKLDEGGVGGRKSVPHMGWNGVSKLWAPNNTSSPSSSSSGNGNGNEQSDGDSVDDKLLLLDEEQYYFVHSYRVAYTPSLAPYVHTVSTYGSERFISSVRLGNLFGTQFHPEKSGPAGLDLLRRWLEGGVEALGGVVEEEEVGRRNTLREVDAEANAKGLTKRIVACLDVRSNDSGDLVVTKGDQYDVREKPPASSASGAGDASSGDVRNLGKPVDLARRYYHEMADEICFLNITSFRNSALQDQPMLKVVSSAAETVFVPLTVGGGIKDTVDPDGTPRSALEVAGAYFRSGADKVSIGTEAVFAVEEMLGREERGEEALSGQTGIETIMKGYGTQAVVVSIDPKRVYVDLDQPEWESSFDPKHRPCLIFGDEAISATREKERGKAWWYQCTIRGGREVRDLDVVQLAQGVERLGAGEILLNSVDRDGSGLGFDLDLIDLVKKNVSIPVVASSGAGKVDDFKELFEKTGVEAGLAAGIFHREEVPLEDVKRHMKENGIACRFTELSTVT